MSNVTFQPGRIQVKEGKWTEDCVTQSNLIENQLAFPAIRQMIEHSEKRMLSTLIASGVTDQSAVGKIKTKIGEVPQDKFIGNNAYQFDVMGRIQRASEISHQIGTTSADGEFELAMKDQMLYNGMNTRFHGAGFHARVMGNPRLANGLWIYRFKSPDGRLFDWNTHVAPQSGAKTCFGGYSSYSEKSLRGYGRSFTPDQFIQHMTIQRKGFSISGGAGSTVLWVQYDDGENTVRGWYYKEMKQNRLALMMEDEYQKWFGLSSMKGDSGELLPNSRLTDPETGLPVIQGDGILPQIAGPNEMYGSGINGEPTMDDVKDMMRTLEKKCEAEDGKVWYVVTGTNGYYHMQNLLQAYAYSYDGLQKQVADSAEIGGRQVSVGYHFKSFNFAGNQLVLVKHPMFDDEQRFTEVGSDGQSIQSSMYVFLDASAVNGKNNLEILSKGGNGFKRNFISAEINGLTGKDGQVVTSEDAVRFEILMENLIVIYNTSSCGIIHKNPNA